jgi:glycosyltransferase involved in cell wall biosynthesis
MKIVFLNPTGVTGGAEAVLLDSIFSLRTAFPDLSLELVLGSDGPLTTKATELGVRTHVVPLPPAVAKLGDSGVANLPSSISRLVLLGKLALAIPSAALYVRELRSLLKSSRPDVIHSNGFKTHVLAALAKPKSSALVWHIHDYVSSRTVMRALMRRYASRCNAAIANSDSVALDIKTTLGNWLPVHTIHNGIDLQRFSPAGPQLDLDFLSELPTASPGTVRVGLIGTLAWWKGHRIFLDALSKISVTTPMRGYVIGGPIYRTQNSQNTLDELVSYAKTLGLEGKVGFTGFIEDVPAALRSLDIVVHASTQPEPFGLVIVEAMAVGKAVISSDAGGAAELVQNGVDALTHVSGDSKDLALRISQLLSDARLRASLGGNARKTAESRFDRRNLAQRLLPIYRQAVSSTSAHTARQQR